MSPSNTNQKWAGRKVLITGGLGFIGSSCAQRFVELGAEVTIFDSLEPMSGGNLQNIAGIEKQVKVLRQDIRDFEAVCKAVAGQETVVHCAALSSHPHSMKDPLSNIAVNCTGTIHLLEAVRQKSPGASFVHVGTSTQTGRMHYQPIDEEHPEFPVDIYSANKCAAEKYVLVYGSAYKMKTTVIRLANTFGPRSSIRSPDFGFMNFFVGLGLQGKDITVFGEGKQLRNVTYVKDSVAAVLALAENDGAWGQVFFAVSDQQCSVAEISESIAREIGGRVRYVEWPKERAAIEIGDAVITNKKIKALTGWAPRWSLADGLVETGNYFRPVQSHYLG